MQIIIDYGISIAINDVINSTNINLIFKGTFTGG